MSTVRTRWKGLHRFCSWLVAEGELSANPMDGLTAPTAPPAPVPVLSDADLGALLKACNGKTFADRRDKALFRFLLDCGVRVSEVCGLRVEDVDLDREMALVTGKGSKIRPVYFGARTARALDRYLRERRRHRWAHLDNLFLGERGPMTPDGRGSGSRSAELPRASPSACTRTGSDTRSPTTSSWPAVRNATSSAWPAGRRT